MWLERWLYVLRQRLRALVHGRQLDDDLGEELRQHLEQEIEANLAAGMHRRAARIAALRAMGGVQQRKEEARDLRGFRGLEDFGRDVRYALRTLRRRPAFGASAIAVLALALGITTAMFSVVHGVLLKPLAFGEADGLFLLSSSPAAGPFGRRAGLSEAQYLDVEQRKRMFETVALFTGGTVNLTGADEPVRLSATRVTPSFFTVLRMTPILGRPFRPDDAQPGQDHVVVLGERIWRDRFGGASDILGRRITLDGNLHEIVGVMPDVVPSGLTFPGPDASVWLPLGVRVTPGNALFRPAIGRLAGGATADRARAELEALTQSADPSPGMPLKADVLPLKELFIGSSRRPLLIFAGVVGFVLLVACTSIANLFLLRTANRRRELSVRAALGASRRRIARQLVVESLVVSLAGGAGGLLLAVLAVPSLVALAPPGLLPRAEAIRVDVVVLGFALALAATVGIVAALGPALQATRLHRPALGPGRTMTFRHQRLSGALVVAEIALTLVLAMGAALFAGSFLRLRSVDAGFRPDRVMTMTVELPSAAYAATSEMQAFHAQVLARLGEAPGAARAAVVNFLPFGPGLITGDFQVAPPDRAPEGASLSADKLAVSPGYFGTMGIRLLRGRDFTSEDRTGGPGVVIISESVANRVWPGHDPLGRRLSVWGQPDNPQWLTIVGVVDDVRQQRLARAGRPALYQPYTQVTRPFLLRQATFVVRAAGDTAATAAALRAAVRHVDRDQPILFMASMDDMVSVQTALPRFQARVVGVLAIAALVLTLVGVYGVLSSAVTERRREMAIRLAIGARPGNVSRLVIGRSLALTAAGTAIGLAGALALTRTLRQFLFEISPTDPATFAVVTIAVVVAATAAAALPAWRATRVDPIEALRAE